MSPDEPIEVLIHPALRPAFEEWLGARGLELARFPDELQEPDRLEKWMARPTPETMRRATGS